MRSWLKAILVLAAPVILLLGLLRALFSADMFYVHHVEVADLAGGSVPAYLRQQMQELTRELASLKGQSIWRISIASIIDRVQTRSWVSSVSVSRKFPDKILISLEKKPPHAGIIANSRSMILVAADGTLFPQAAFHQVPDVVLLQGAELRESQALRQQAIALYERIPDSGLLQKAKVDNISYIDGSGFALSLVDGKTQVLLGEEFIELRLARVEKVLSYLQSKSIIGRVIDANYQKKVLVRLRKGA